MHPLRLLRALTGVCLAAGLTVSVSALPIIYYEATDLTDIAAGEDLWQYNYTVEGFDFEADQGFSIFFGYASFQDLEDPPPAVNADWDVISIPPDAILGDGFYDGLALVDLPSLSDVFQVSFLWLGSGTPGSQPFEIYDDSDGLFTILFEGTTRLKTIQIPDSTGTGWLIVLAMVALAGARELDRLKCTRRDSDESGAL